MKLSPELIAQFVKATNDSPKQETKSDTLTYGTLYKNTGGATAYTLKLDGYGSDAKPIPVGISNIATGVAIPKGKDSVRVVVLIKNHAVTIVSSLEASGANVTTLDGLIVDLAAVDTIIADNIKIHETLDAYDGRFTTLDANVLNVEGTLTAAVGRISALETNTLTAAQIKAQYASIEMLKNEYATIENLTSLNTYVYDLEATHAKIDFANITDAAIEKIFSNTGIIQDLSIKDGAVTGKLASVKVTSDVIDANTIKADRLIIRGADGLYYQLNAGVDGVTEAQLATDEYQQKLHGDNIIAKSIAATKINVSDLQAFGATIGGFHLTTSSLYSGAKSSIDNAAIGIYMDKDGKAVIGGPSEYIKYDGSSLLISVTDLTINAKKLSVLLSDAAKSATNYMSLTNDGLTIGDMSGDALGDNIVIGTNAIKIRNGATVNSIFGSDIIELAKDNESATISMLNGAFKIYYDKDISDGGFGIYGKDLNGDYRLAFQPVNENGNTTLGWGNYAAQNGNTNIYGNDVYIGVSYNGTVKETFRPYYRKGDSFTVRFRGAGYVTTAGKDIRFSVPISKPILGNPSISINSIGFTLRQGGNYAYGSSDSSTVNPTAITGAISGDGNFIRIGATFSNTTNVINNDTIGIDWEGTIIFD